MCLPWLMKRRFANCEIDPERHEFWRADELVKLEPQVFDLIALLAENPGRLISRDDLINSIWDGRAVSDSTIDARIAAARRAVGDDGARQEVIETVPRRGIRLVTNVQNPDPSLSEDAPFKNPKSISSAPKSDNSQLPVVAVLPFSNLSQDEQDQFFAEGISEDITTELSRFSSIRVISRMSSFQYRRTSLDLAEVSERLGASFILSGSVRRSHDRIRISVSLGEMATGTQVWAERYDRPLDDIFAVQDEIAEIVASTLTGRVHKIGLQRAQTKRPGSLTAYEHFLKGLDLHKSGDVSPDTAKAAFAHFSDAIAEDADFARAYAWRACTFSRTWSFPITELERESCIADINRALNLDPTEPEANRIVGAICRLLGEYDKADRHIARALSLNPNDAHITIKAAEHNCFIGKPKEARTLIDRAKLLNPSFPEWYWEIDALADYVAQNFEAAVANVAKLDFPTFAGYAYQTAAEQELGRPKEASATIKRLKTAYPHVSLSVYGRHGQRFHFRDERLQDKFISALAKAGLQ